MATKLIRLDDGVLVEVEVPPDQAQAISGGAAEKVTASLDKIRPVLHSLALSLAAGWRELSESVRVEQAELEIGLSFEAEGNLYVTKAKSTANLTVRLVFKPQDKSQDNPQDNPQE
jgi:NTP-dependent ternary system trypsin peptidase co-occuring protein